MKRAAIYARVSTNNGQTTENQIRELEQVAERAGWQVVKVYEDQGISGSKGRDRRPQLDALLNAVIRREVDMVMTWAVDRLGRSLKDLIGTMQEIKAAEAGLYLHKQAIDTTTPAGKAMFGMLEVFAEFERDMIRERINAGLARARENKSIRLGRPPLSEETKAQVRKMRSEGMSLRKIAAKSGIGLSSVQRILKNFKKFE